MASKTHSQWHWNLLVFVCFLLVDVKGWGSKLEMQGEAVEGQGRGLQVQGQGLGEGFPDPLQPLLQGEQVN